MIKITKFRKTIRSVSRYREILQILFKYGFEDFLDRIKITGYIHQGKKILLRQREKEYARTSRQIRVRLAIEELGPTFIKLGQMLSTRFDFIPPDFIHELRKLQDRVAPFSGSEALQIIEKELNDSIENLFNDFDHNPFAAASIAQAHHGITKDGSQVIIKVQRPAIHSTIERDMDILTDLAALITRYIPESEIYNPLGIVDEFKHWINSELDFYQEGRNIDRFRKNFMDDKTVHIPRVYWSLTTDKVLTMEYVEGISVQDIAQLEQAGLDRKIIALNGAQTVLKQIFEYGFFHGDPHPGNIFVLPGNIIAPLDYGLMGRLDEDLMILLGDLARAIIHKEIHQIIRILLNIGIVEDNIDLHRLKHDLSEFIDRYYQVPLSQISIEKLTNEIMGLVAQYKIRFPKDLYLMTKALVVIESIGRKLNPDFDMVSIAKPIIEKLILHRLDPQRLMRVGMRLADDYWDLIDIFPYNLKQIFQKIRKGKLSINLQHQGLERMIRELDKSTNRIAFSLIIASLIIGSSFIIQIERGPKLLGIPAFGLIGYLIAALLGLWLVIAIMRSGRL